MGNRMKPMLANTIVCNPRDGSMRDALIRFCNDERYSMTQKIDGIRILMDCTKEVIALNRRGIPTSKEVDEAVLKGMAHFAGSETIFDGEYVREDKTYYIFDLASHAGLSYDGRRALLESTFKSWASRPACIKLIPRYVSAKEKIEAAVDFLTRRSEGVMFNDRRATYRAGKRCDAVLKLKFIKDIDCVVLRYSVEGKSSIALGVYDEHGRMIEVGDCTTLAGDRTQIKIGDVVTVQYLYAVFPQAPRLYQPTLPRIRRDKTPRECVLNQIQFTNKEVIA
jgi:ATP-dependent DNA ligase